MNRLVASLFLIFFCFNVALASRARVEIGQSFYESQSVYSYLLFPTLAEPEVTRLLLETGTSVATSRAQVPGAIVQYSATPDWTGLLSVGILPEIVSLSREDHNLIEVKSFQLPQNSLTAIAVKRFSGQSLAMGLSRSEFKDLTNDLFEYSTVAVLAYRWRFLHSALHVVLDDRVNVVGNEVLRLRQPFQYSLLYRADQSEFSLQYRSFFQVSELNGSELTSIDQQDVSLGYLDRTAISMINFSYRVEYVSKSVIDRLANSSNRSNSIPVTFLFETKIGNGINLLGSVRQPIWINQGTGNQVIQNQTQVMIGASVDWNKAKITGSLNGLSGAAATQKLDGSQLLSRVGLEYSF